MTSGELRNSSRGTLLLGLQPLTTWVPFKKTISYSQILNSNWSLQLEYSWSSLATPGFLKLGEISEKRYSLMAKRYLGNSFYLDFGAVYSDIKAQLGSRAMDLLINQNSTRSLEVANWGALVGLGNRWQWDNGVTFGVDWIRMNLPLFTSKNEDNILSNISSSNSRSQIKSYIDKFNHIPTFVILGVNLGYTF